MTDASSTAAGPAPASPAPAGPAIWGILNVTPDSFSDGGRFVNPQVALRHAQRMVADGASIIDVGGESTRPGAERVSPEVEQGRVLPVIRALAAASIPVSIDTMNASTAAAAVDAGARIVNDVSGGLADPAMATTVAGLNADYVAMHWRGHSHRWDQVSDYANVVADVTAELRARRDALLGAGIAPERLWLDPGIGFAKGPDHNWQLLRGLATLRSLGHPLLVGASRKRFLGALLPSTQQPVDRDVATAAVSVMCADAGVAAVRVHNVTANAQALAAWRAWRGSAS